MLYDLIRKYKGKDTVMMTDTYAQVKNRKHLLEQSSRNGIRGNRISLSIKKSEAKEKYKRKPVDETWRGG